MIALASVARLAAAQEQIGREMTSLQATDQEILARMIPASPPLSPPAAPTRKPPAVPPQRSPRWRLTHRSVGRFLEAYFRVDELLRQSADPNLHDIPRNLPFRVEMWDVRLDTHALDAAIVNYPDQRFTLRNGALVIRQHPARWGLKRRRIAQTVNRAIATWTANSRALRSQDLKSLLDRLENMARNGATEASAIIKVGAWPISCAFLSAWSAASAAVRLAR
jgi:hypothetical protein